MTRWIVGAGRYRRYDGPLEGRFWKRVNKRRDDECWLWSGQRLNDRYGLIHVQRIPRLAHRVAYELCVGPIPQGLCVRHACDVPACVNPKHLSVGTIKDNNSDMVIRNRVARGETAGQAKVSDADVDDMRSAWQSGMVKSRATLGVLFGISPGQASRIVRGLSRLKSSNGHPASKRRDRLLRRLRPILLLRADNRCESPFCRSPARLDLHHIQKRSAGGIESVTNLVALCRRCHARTDLATGQKGYLRIETFVDAFNRKYAIFCGWSVSDPVLLGSLNPAHAP